MNRTKIFEAVKRLLKRGFTQPEVDLLDDAIDAAIDAPTIVEQPESPRNISPVGIALLHHFEGFGRVRQDGLVEAYPDPGTGGDPWTIGWGSTGLDHFNGGWIKRGTIWTRAQCDEGFERDIAKYAAEVVVALGPAIDNTSQAQFDALVSFHYNTGAIRRATLTRKHVAGDHAGAAKEFARWNRAGGQVLKGLVRRRAAEEQLYRSGM